MFLGNKRKQARQLFVENRQLFIALGDETRQEILLLLGDGKRRSVAELAHEMGIARPTISHHIKLLHEVDLLGVERVGTKHLYYPVFTSHIPKLQKMTETLQQLDQLHRRK